MPLGPAFTWTTEERVAALLRRSAERLQKLLLGDRADEAWAVADDLDPIDYSDECAPWIETH